LIFFSWLGQRDVIPNRRYYDTAEVRMSFPSMASKI
jgi:hypothetical protein